VDLLAEEPAGQELSERVTLSGGRSSLHRPFDSFQASAGRFDDTCLGVEQQRPTGFRPGARDEEVPSSGCGYAVRTAGAPALPSLSWFARAL
jgi:hypothetical protein